MQFIAQINRQKSRVLLPRVGSLVYSVYLTVETLTRRLDYCNSLYHLLPIIKLKRLQQIQNAPARDVTNEHAHNHACTQIASLAQSQTTPTIHIHIYYSQTPPYI